MADTDDSQEESDLSGLPFEHLIAAPFLSAAKASAQLAHVTSNAISELAAADPLRFSLTRHREVPDPSEPDGSRTVEETVEVSLPVLGAVAPPTLQIQSMNVLFNLELRAVKHEAGEEEGRGTTLVGRPSSHAEHTRDTDKMAKFSFDIHASSTGIPEPLARIVDLLAQGVVAVPAPRASVEDAPTLAELETFKRYQLYSLIDRINRRRPPESQLSKGGRNDDLVVRIRDALVIGP